MLIAEHVTKTYQAGGIETLAVKDASLTLTPGELTVLVGESGSGKTTLCRLLAGIAAPSAGTVLLDGRSIAPPARRKDRTLCAAIQMVLQDGKSALDPEFIDAVREAGELLAQSEEQALFLDVLEAEQEELKSLRKAFLNRK